MLLLLMMKMIIMIRPVVTKQAKSATLDHQKLDGDGDDGDVADDADDDYYYGDVAAADDDDDHDKAGGKEECQVSNTR